MNKENQKINKLFYLPHRLIKKMEGMDQYPLTLVEAPSGFGKTTAVREYLKAYKPHVVQHWYTCLGETPAKAWSGICDMLSLIDDGTASVLKKLDLPTVDTLADMALNLRSLRCESETFLVIDNYQLVGSNLPRHMINAFSTHGNSNLHIVFITQQLKESYSTTVHHANIYGIDNSDLLFDRKTISSYFRMAGIRLTGKELNALNNSTEGWISAIRLQMINYQQTGTFARTTDIELLVKTAVWNLLSDGERNFLLSMSVLDGFTTRQAQIMMDEVTLPESILNLLDENAFIRYLPEKDQYTLHSILQDYLKSRFYNHQPERFQTLILRRAGKSCAYVGDYYAAARFYYKIQDYEAILSLPFDGVYLNNQKERDVLNFITDFVNSCPEKILCKYPMASVGFAFHLYMGGQQESYIKLYRLVTSVIQNSERMSEAEFNRIKGEFALLASFDDYNDIQKMSKGHRIALAYLDGPSLFLIPDTSWTFGNVSVLNMFWRKTGELEKELDDMDECMPIYSKLVQGHGVSANIVMRAESLLLQGADAEAEALCHKALYLGRSQNQIVLCLCAELVLARIAILRGDVDAFRVALDSLNRYIASPVDRFILRAVELCIMSLKLVLGETKGLADWIYDLESMKKVLYIQAIPYGHLLYGKIILIDKRYNELYGLSGLMMGMAEEMNYLLPKVYSLIYLAVAKYRQGQRVEAQELLVKSLHIALPDKVYLPFAEHGNAIMPLLELVRPEVSDWEGLDAVVALCKRQEKGMKTISKLILSQKNVLTPREREIALLAKDGLSVKQIAEVLFISVNTVKSALRIIYSKLDVHSKVQLTKVNF
ncbi:LuxR C-terminal-related transcriptional regulator [Anaerovorax odorimutans]|uniref:LuxR C-terminal-related transcriptional regulator n=1 Tax=Anaerovorax odorimutans TaxID=109327 RepID=UPI00040AA763|nr:LuxR C-terminal-related transcriptional regulator [Anaerovorax odorimutans]